MSDFFDVISDKFQYGDFSDKIDCIGYVPIVGGQAVGLARLVYSVAVPVLCAFAAIGCAFTGFFNEDAYVWGSLALAVCCDAAQHFPRAIAEFFGFGLLLLESDLDDFEDRTGHAW